MVDSYAVDSLYQGNVPADYNTFTFDYNTRMFNFKKGMERDVNDEGGCFTGMYGDGVFTGFVGTHPHMYYEDGLNGLLTVEEKSGQIELFTAPNRKTPIILTGVSGNPLDDNRNCLNDETCDVNELGTNQVGYVDENDPLTSQEIPDAGGDVFDPFADAGADAEADAGEMAPTPKTADSGSDGGCAVCAASPNDVSSDINGYITLLLAAGAMAYRRKRREG